MEDKKLDRWPVLASRMALAKRLPDLVKRAVVRVRERTQALTAKLDRDTLIRAGSLATSAAAIAWAVYVEMKRTDAASPDMASVGEGSSSLATHRAPNGVSETEVHRVLVTEYVRTHSRTTHRVGADYEETIVELAVEALRFVSIETRHEAHAPSGPQPPSRRLK